MIQGIERVGKTGRRLFEIYSRSEFQQGWKSAYPETIERTKRCVETLATKEQALVLSALFVRTIYPDKLCTHYDGTTLSIFCGRKWAGEDTKRKTKAMVSNYFKSGVPKLKTPLFEDDLV